MGVSKHRKGERRRRIACKDERRVRIIATSRAVEVRRGNQGRSRVLSVFFWVLLFTLGDDERVA
jgi:hypothetical protein